MVRIIDNMDVRPFLPIGAAFLTFLMQNDPDGFKPTVKTRTPDELLPEYDFIVLGAGSAGSAVAERLSENPEWNILLLEAGGQENHWQRTPGMEWPVLFSKFNWNYTTSEQKRACLASKGKCRYPQGRALGGSSSVNFMIYLRGYRSDFDRWGVENPGWDFAGVEPYFLKSEGSRLGLPDHGTKGPLTVSYLRYQTPIRDSIKQGGEELGWAGKDCMDYEDSCIEFLQTTIRDGRRCSASTAYLESVSEKRNNLHIVTNALVTDIIWKDGNTAEGVKYTWGEKVFVAKASKELISSLGSIGTAKLLMLSGVGPKYFLESLQIPVVVDLPVGHNLQDHPRVILSWSVKNGSATTISQLAGDQETYLLNQTGALSYSGPELIAFNKMGLEGPPIIQYHITTQSNDEHDKVGVFTTLVRPRSRGTVRLNTTDPRGEPIIDPNYYGNDVDFTLTEAGMKGAIELMKTEALKPYNPILLPMPACPNLEPVDDFIKCSIELYTSPVYHACSTTKMSPQDQRGVVNTKLQVYGVNRLRVIDASIAPYIISMNTNAMSIMIGEKGADIIKMDYGFRQSE